MATCPKCDGPMESTDGVCLQCQLEFQNTLATSPAPKVGFAYSRVADLALTVGLCCAVLGCVVAILWTLVLMARGNALAPMIGVLAFFQQLGMVIVFMRVSDLKK